MELVPVAIVMPERADDGGWHFLFLDMLYICIGYRNTPVFCMEFSCDFIILRWLIFEM